MVQRPLRALAALVTLAVALSALSSAFVAAPGASAAAAPRARSDAASSARASALTSLRAGKGDNKPSSKETPGPIQLEFPFPKFIVGGAVLFGIIGYIGGGWTLCQVFFFSGAGLGLIFEPPKEQIYADMVRRRKKEGKM
mmetsp:Transcript_105432/g.267877  ORF Transcript_105432/g.267877 Transcript_105432/m.267877 type:complete len:140 (+) Transcript_105432:84-503(+)|eukprot:CAMPEP_0183425780 /NCGR_PEP_ID=MMETSP0370-20130417/36519_1 /TAXON_ID=268820 /ORGANISM="Peridinium aciculiferum, Strain PAER-2" /LENGTH=139 /DNA_ID=CAMNT_0025610101 /DNA_START=85 /DNA_END=504 /DNA_ORIENTATION=-